MTANTFSADQEIDDKASKMLERKYKRIRITLPELAAELGLSPDTLYNQRSSGKLQIPTLRDGGKVFADVRDVGEYLDKMRAEACAAFRAE